MNVWDLHSITPFPSPLYSYQFLLVYPRDFCRRPPFFQDEVLERRLHIHTAIGLMVLFVATGLPATTLRVFVGVYPALKNDLVGRDGFEVIGENLE